MNPVIKKVFNFVEYGTRPSFFLRMTKEIISIKEENLNLEDSKNKIEKLKYKRETKETYIVNKW